MNLSEKRIKESLKLYFVMGSVNCLKDPATVLQEAIAGGITLFQFREKGNGAKTGYEKISLAKKLQAICKQHDIPFIVNDDIDLALQIDADGVHIGQEDEDPLKVRKKIGSKILGISAHNLEEAQKAIEHGADYLGVGPMYFTSTKTDIREVKGPEVIKIIRMNDIQIPIVGIGGIKQNLARNVIKAGADGVAIISAISQSPDPKLAAKQLLNEVEMAF
ncbi:thiamine phosphate synthase [Calidifontibacillus erzurumensis]|uniref:Thiamine-phosphate synthase n=1 Tax=Calidifontibacillus erzurumensis TaxID=2741433 RepID=A0A8J8GBZ0_9BACI|nr:thiamine phosphate synthase [Calidifontibacillus erzurumensis]NSL50622.1 thiamine phosphate synthase [Calidifontibacillus erzurumensis]